MLHNTLFKTWGMWFPMIFIGCLWTRGFSCTHQCITRLLPVMQGKNRMLVLVPTSHYSEPKWLHLVNSSMWNYDVQVYAWLQRFWINWLFSSFGGCLQAAATRSLAQGTTLDKVLGMLKEVHMFLAKATVFGANNMMSEYYLRGMNMAYRWPKEYEHSCFSV